MAPFLSFKRLLRKYLMLHKPELILEWGPGASTLMIMKERPNVEVHTIEHNLNWFNKWREEFKRFRNVYVYCIPLIENYHRIPLAFKQAGDFDLVFVDGRHRVNCLKTAKKVLRKGGIAILHDSERKRYTEGKNLFRILEESDGTAVMENHE